MKFFLTLILVSLMAQSFVMAASSQIKIVVKEDNILQATDSQGSKYDIINGLLSGCQIMKTDKGGSIKWVKIYDRPQTCTGIRIAISEKDEVYAVFRVDANSQIHTLSDTAKKAFKRGLWTQMGETQGFTILDAIVQINNKNGELNRGTFLMSKYCSPFINQCISHPLMVEDRFEIGDRYLNIDLFSFAYPPGEQSDQNRFYFLTDHSGDQHERVKIRLSLSKDLRKIESVNEI